MPNQNDHGKTMEYIPCFNGYQVVCVDSKFSKPPKIYRGPNASENVLTLCYLKKIISKTS